MYRKIHLNDVLKIDPDNEYVKIYHHFGQENQCKKLIEEINELVEALQSGDRERVFDETVDVLVLAQQIIEAWQFTAIEIQDGMSKKHGRTVERINIGYYNEEELTVCDGCRHQPICTWSDTCTGQCANCWAYNLLCDPRFTPCAKRKQLAKGNENE